MRVKLFKNISRILIVFSAIFVVFFVWLLIFDTNEVPGDGKGRPTETPKSTVIINDLEILVEVADTPAKRTLGLGQRAYLPENEGMLFPFGDTKVPVRFWMKGMEIPIDMIFIADGKIVDIAENAMPEPGVSDEKLKAYVPTEPVNYVLEVNAGFSERNNIEIGDSFSF